MHSLYHPHIDYRNIDALKQFEGGDWGPESGLCEIKDSQIQAFAHVTNNHQWIHTDDERSVRESPYGKKIAHGLYLLSLIPGIDATNGFTLTGSSVRIIRRIEHVRFPAPAFAGDRICARSRLLSVEVPDSGKGVVLTSEIKVWRWDEHKVLAWTWNDVDIWERMESTERPVVSCHISFQHF